MPCVVRSVNVPPDAPGSPLVPATGPVDIGLHGFAADPASFAHALYAYPTVHEPFWRTVRAQARVAPPDTPLPPASFDEHLALDGVQESQLWIGDVLRLPDCVLVVSAPRMPDERFNATLGFPHAAKMVAQSRWGGFWLGVRVPGRIAAGDPFEVLPGPRETGLAELFRARIDAARGR